jgi:polar amino acid transport system substrate-binding protein
MRLLPGRLAGCILPILVSLFTASPSNAQTCGTDYIIQNRDTLADIAARVYGRASDWSILLYANQDRLGTNASLMVPGLAIRIPCVGEAQKPLPDVATTPAQDSGPAPQSSFIVSSTLNKIEFLTADGFAPFTGRLLANGGMITQLLSRAMDHVKQEAKGKFDYGVSWVNDWASHLNPLLVSRAFDAGFPWVKPDCSNLANLDADGRYRCQKFFFSQPLYETLTHLFVDQNSKVNWDDEQKYLGRNFCRPAGYTTYEFDQDGRNWLKDSKILLMRPPSVEECFRLLEAGSADAVVVPDLVGQGAISAMGLAKNIRMIEKPFAIHTLHVIVPKSHPHARTILYYINASLSQLRETGEFDTIVEEHLTRFWDAQGGYTGSGDIGKKQGSEITGASPASAQNAPNSTSQPLTAKGEKK